MPSITSYGSLEPRNTGQIHQTVNDIVNKPEMPEKKKGAMANLKSRFEDLKAKLQRAQSSDTVEKRLSANSISGPLKPADMKATLQNIRQARLASMSNKNPAKVTSLPQQDPVLSKNAQSLRNAITLGLTKMLEEGQHGAKYDATDVASFSHSLAICLGLAAKDSQLTMDQFASLVAVKSDIELHLQPDVREKFDTAMMAAEKKLGG